MDIERSFNLNSQIISSIFESNLFLINNKPTLIEYAISCWFKSFIIDLCHSNNLELISFLEKEKVDSDETKSKKYYVY